MTMTERRLYVNTIFAKEFFCLTDYDKILLKIQELPQNTILNAEDIPHWDNKCKRNSYAINFLYAFLVYYKSESEAINWVIYCFNKNKKLVSNQRLNDTYNKVVDKSFTKNYPEIEYSFFDFSGQNLL